MAKSPDVLPMNFDKPMPGSGRRAASLYDATVAAFLESEKPHAEIGGDSTAQARYLGLKNAIDRMNVADRVSVTRRSGEIWLVREK